MPESIQQEQCDLCGKLRNSKDTVEIRKGIMKVNLCPECLADEVKTDLKLILTQLQII